jgi:hypothetical protein
MLRTRYNEVHGATARGRRRALKSGMGLTRAGLAGAQFIADATQSLRNRLYLSRYPIREARQTGGPETTIANEDNGMGATIGSAAILVVVWLGLGSGTTYQVTFSSVALCEAARKAVFEDAARTRSNLPDEETLTPTEPAHRAAVLGITLPAPPPPPQQANVRQAHEAAPPQPR